MNAPAVSQIQPLELKTRLDRGDDIFLLDVREGWEFSTASLPGSHLIPLGELVERIQEFQAEEEIVVICHHGIRSYQGAQWLRELGFGKVHNLVGGIDGYSQVADPSIPRY